MYIYKTTNLVNGKIYIGLSTKSVEESQSYYGSGALIKEAIRKYGKSNFAKEILEQNVTSREDLIGLEKYWIAHHKSNNREIGYNLTHGGDGTGGLEFTKERREKIGNANRKPKTGKALESSKNNMAIARSKVTNFSKSDTTRARISLAIKGRHWYHNPANPIENGQYYEAPVGWNPGRGSAYTRPSGLTYKNSKSSE
jgi:group I intron endonuclease